MDIDQLLADLALAKTNLSNAKEQVLKAEKEVIEAMDLKERGSTSLNGTNGLKVTVTTGYTYKLESGFPTGMPTKVETKLDSTKYEKVRENDPELFKTLSQFVTAKPKKPSVALKVG